MMIGYRANFRHDEELALAFDMVTRTAADVLGIEGYGIAVGGPFEEFSEEDLDKLVALLFDLGLESSFYLIADAYYASREALGFPMLQKGDAGAGDLTFTAPTSCPVRLVPTESPQFAGASAACTDHSFEAVAGSGIPRSSKVATPADMVSGVKCRPLLPSRCSKVIPDWSATS